jgi:hypothetical protein
MNAYLLIFDDTQASRADIVASLDRAPAVENWLAFMPASLYVASSHPASEIAAILRRHHPDLRFLLAPVDLLHADGALEPQVWKLLQEPQVAAAAE